MKTEELPTRGLRDLTKILKLIIQNRYQLTLIMVFFLSIGAYYIISKPKLYLSTTKVYSLAGNDFYKYQSVGDALNFEVSPSSLLELFAYKLKDKKAFYPAIKLNGLIDIKPGVNNDTLERLITEYAASIEIKKDYVPMGGNNDYFWTISASHTNIKKWLKIIKEVEVVANKHVYQDIYKSIKNGIKVYHSKILDLEKMFAYFQEKENSNPSSGKFNKLNYDEKQLTILEKKFYIVPFGLATNSTIKYSLDEIEDQIFLHNLRLEKMKNALATLEKHKDNFNSVKIEILETKHKSLNKNLLIIIIFTLASIFSSFLFLTYKKFKSAL